MKNMYEFMYNTCRKVRSIVLGDLHIANLGTSRMRVCYATMTGLMLLNNHPANTPPKASDLGRLMTDITTTMGHEEGCRSRSELTGKGA
jgi:hypothetical protein